MLSLQVCLTVPDFCVVLRMEPRIGYTLLTESAISLNCKVRRVPGSSSWDVTSERKLNHRNKPGVDQVHLVSAGLYCT